jgi:hypothetical protein
MVCKSVARLRRAEKDIGPQPSAYARGLTFHEAHGHQKNLLLVLTVEIVRESA